MNLKISGLSKAFVPLLMLAICCPTPSLSEFETDSDYVDRADVQTYLELSPWELYVLGDLVFKMAQKECPKMDNDVLESFKDRFEDALRTVPKSDMQNEEFLPAYSHLVQCMDYIMMKKGEIEVDEKRMKIIEVEGMAIKEVEVQSSETDWVAPDDTQVYKTTTNTENPVQETSALLETLTNWFWSATYIPHWIRHGLIRTKATTESTTIKPEPEKLVRTGDKRQEQKRNHQKVLRSSRQNIANFFHEACKLIRKSCPIIHRPAKVFMRKALLDMTTWLTLEHHQAIMLSNQYFVKHELLKQIIECNKIQ